MTETCASAHIGGVNIVLLEGITPDIQYVQSLLFRWFTSYIFNLIEHVKLLHLSSI